MIFIAASHGLMVQKSMKTQRIWRVCNAWLVGLDCRGGLLVGGPTALLMVVG